MTKKLHFLFLILLTVPIYAQWEYQYSGVGETLNDVYCINEDFVVVVGDAGTILKTTDGGEHWIQKASDDSFSLRKVQFASPNIGYIIGSNLSTGVTTFLKTIDGGENWISIPIENTVIMDLYCVNENIIYITTYEGSLKKSMNGGTSFETANSDQFLMTLQFINEMVGFASSGDTLLKTIDGGASWSAIGDVNFMFSRSVFYFLNELVGYKMFLSNLYKTTDGGLNYTYLSSLYYNINRLVAPTENIVWGVSGELLLNGSYNHTMRGELSGNGDFQRIDGDPFLRSIYFASETKGYGVAWGGQIFKNTTGTLVMGTAQVDKKNAVRIYPNPASGFITVSFTENQTQSFSVAITDFLGKNIYSKSYATENSVTINTENFSRGIYFLTLISQDKKQTQKLIIN